MGSSLVSLDGDPCTIVGVESPDDEGRWGPDDGRVYLSCAVLALGHHGDVVVLDYFGPAIEWHVDAYSSAADDLGLDGWDEGPGLFVWVGTMGSRRHETLEGVDWDFEVTGDLRPPTDAEWAAIRAGVCPWTKENCPRREPGGPRR